MTDSLFPLPESAPSALDVARRRLVIAALDWDFSSFDSVGIPDEIVDEYIAAKAEVARLERAAFARRKL